jgi:Raf kinase inhibitor-like YbhB/YbcL family protein
MAEKTSNSGERSMNLHWLGRLLRGVRAGDRHSVANHPALNGVPETISLESAWFLNDGHMPLGSAGIGVGENISPPFTWKGIPAEAVELAIIMEDMDAPLHRPFVHMIACGISPDRTGMAEGTLAHRTRDVYFGKSTLGAQGYMGPRPVPGHGPHRYVFYILALNRYTKFQSPPKLKEFLKDVTGTVVAYGHLVGAYERS